jgi:hypothetical protein
MPFEPLHSRLPAVAETETRSVIAINETGLPPAEYGFVEMFCNEPGCDCRRVFFTVFSSFTQKPVAVIAYGWESTSFYRKWFKNPISNLDLAELQGPVLNACSPQSPYAPAILKLFTEVLLADTTYIKRVKSHYKLFRATVARS